MTPGRRDVRVRGDNRRVKQWLPVRRAAWREDRVKFWATIAAGARTEEAIVAAGVSIAVGFRWVRHAHGRGLGRECQHPRALCWLMEYLDAMRAQRLTPIDCRADHRYLRTLGTWAPGHLVTITNGPRVDKLCRCLAL